MFTSYPLLLTSHHTPISHIFQPNIPPHSTHPSIQTYSTPHTANKSRKLSSQFANSSIYPSSHPPTLLSPLYSILNQPYKRNTIKPNPQLSIPPIFTHPLPYFSPHTAILTLFPFPFQKIHTYVTHLRFTQPDNPPNFHTANSIGFHSHPLYTPDSAAPFPHFPLYKTKPCHIIPATLQLSDIHLRCTSLIYFFSDKTSECVKCILLHTTDHIALFTCFLPSIRLPAYL